MTVVYDVLTECLNKSGFTEAGGVPLILCFLPFEWAERAVTNGFAALESMPDWYQYTLGVIVAASFGVRSATKFFGKK